MSRRLYRQSTVEWNDLRSNEMYVQQVKKYVHVHIEEYTCMNLELSTYFEKDYLFPIKAE